MADKISIGGKLGLDGEADFKKAISGIGKDMAVLGSEMKKVTAEFSDNANSLEALNAKADVFNKQADAQKSKIELIKNALAESAKQYGENSDKVKDWQIKLNNAEADLAKTENSLKSTTDQINNFGKGANTSGDDVEKAGKQAKSSGDDAEKGESGWSKLGSGLAKVGAAAGAAIAAIGTAAAGAATALAGMTVSAAGYADDMLTMSAQTGISTDELQKFKYASGLVDVELETLTKSMAKQIKSMSGAADGSKQAVAAYAELGVSVTNADGSLRDGQTVYWEVIDALGKVTNETERDALAMQILGKSAQELNPLIEAGSGKLKELGDQAVAAGAVMSGETLDAFGKFDDQLQFLQGGADAAKNALGTVLLPILGELAGTGTDLLAQFTTGVNAANGDMSKISEVIGTTLGSAIQTLMEKLPEFIEYGMQIITSVSGAITDNLPTLITAVTGIAMDIIKNLVDSLPDILQTGIDILMALIDGIIEALPELIPAVIEAITTIVQGLIDNLPKILQAALDIILALAKGLLDALPELIKALPKIITGIIDFIIGAIPQIIETGIALLIALVDALPEIIEAIVEAIPEIIDGIINAFLDNIPLIIDAGIKLFTALIENLPVIIVAIVKAVPDIIAAIVKGFSENFPKMKEVGTNLITGLWNGIKDAGAWLYEKISGFFGGVVKKIKDFFGIKSPSKLFRDEIGKNLALGIGEGFESGMNKVSKDMAKAIPSNISLNGVGGSARTYNNNPVINIYQPVKSPYAVSREVKKSMNQLVYGV